MIWFSSAGMNNSRLFIPGNLVCSLVVYMKILVSSSILAGLFNQIVTGFYSLLFFYFEDIKI